MPWATMLPCQTACGDFGSVTSTAVIDSNAVPDAQNVLPSGEKPLSWPIRATGRVDCSTGCRQSWLHVVDRDQAGVGRRVAEHRGEQPAPRVEVQRLVRREHRQLGQRVGLHRVRGIGHVDHRDALRGRVELERVDGVQQRGVVERALAPALVDVAQHLEAARACPGGRRATTLQCSPSVAAPAGTRPWIPGSRLEPGPHCARGVATSGGSAFCCTVALAGCCPMPWPSASRSLSGPSAPSALSVGSPSINAITTNGPIRPIRALPRPTPPN